MTDLVERHKPREGRRSATRQVRNAGVSATAPEPREREDSPSRAEQNDRAPVDQRVE